MADPSPVSGLLAWLEACVQASLQAGFGGKDSLPPPPELPEGYFFSGWDRTQLLPLVMCLAEWGLPEVWDHYHRDNLSKGYIQSAYGITRSRDGMGLYPTLHTAAWLLGGPEAGQRYTWRTWLQESALIVKQEMLREPEPGSGEPDHALRLKPVWLAQFRQNTAQAEPLRQAGFPAQRLETRLEWEDLVLPVSTQARIQEVLDWIRYGVRLMEDPDLSRRISPGYRCLFHGPPGTGKSMTAALIGKSTGLPVYRIDLSMIVSKYIGETEKNLGKVFDAAQDQNWILFFDEADALFGKRTQTRHANDRYANQEVSYLLQRIEEFPGVILLASNFRGNMDDAFSRRFQTIVHFMQPDAQLRLQLWTQAFSRHIPQDADVDLRMLAERFKITGSEITNVVRYASMKAFTRTPVSIRQADILEALKHIWEKEGRVLDGQLFHNA